LELKAEEGAVEEGAENVGGEVRSGERSFDGIDEIEGVEVGDECQDGDQSDRRQYQRQLDVPENAELAETVDAGGVRELLGDVEQRRIDQHHRDANELPDGNQRKRNQRGRWQPEPGREPASQAYRLEGALRDAPERRQDQIPGKADDDDGQHRRQKDDGAVERLE